MKIYRLLLGLSVLFASSRAAADPYAPSTLVNVPSAAYKTPLSVATNSSGESVVAWTDAAITGAPRIFIERYDSWGRLLGSDDQQVGSLVRDVAIDDAGNFALLGIVSSSWTVSLYQRSGQFVRDIRVQEPGARIPSGNLTPASLAMNARGQFAVTWTQETATGQALVARSFAADGSASSATVTVFDARPAFEPDIAVDSSGNFAVTWDRFRSATDHTSEIWVRRFAVGGAPLSNALLVSTDARTDANRGRIAMNPSGAFVIAWISRGAQPPSSADQTMMAQRFSVLGQPLGSVFRVDSSSATWPSVAMAANGSFVIAWGPGQAGALAHTYDANGAPTGDPFRLDTLPGVGFMPKVGMDASGNITAMWGQLAKPGTSDEVQIYVRKFTPWTSPTLQNGIAVGQLGGSLDSWRFYKVSVPPGRSSVDFSIFGGTGDADLYVRWGSLPTLEEWDGAPFLNGNNETARMLNFPPGDWYVGIHAYAAYSGLGVRATY